MDERPTVGTKCLNHETTFATESRIRMRYFNFKKKMKQPASKDDDETSPEVPVGRAAARGTLMTLLLRLFSFVLSQYTFRIVQNPEVLGKANIQLELLLTTVLFISREGFRLALTRNVSPDNWNVAWLTIPLATFTSGLAMVWHLSTFRLDGEDTDWDFRLAGALYCIASWLEGIAEPAVLYFLRRLNVPARVTAEGLATIAKTVTTIVALQNLDEKWAVTAFGISQLVYGLTYAIFLYASAWEGLTWPSFTSSSFDRSTCYLTAVFTVQGFFKHLLTEADKIVLTWVSDSYDQGVYAMASAYGGMAARVLLQPLEENARLLWSRVASTKPTKGSDSASKDAAVQANDDALERSYTTLVKMVLYIGFVFCFIAVNYTSILLNIMAGRKWGSNPEAANVLSAFCIYTAFLAWNGMTEAFVYAVTASGLEIGRLGIAHTITGMAFAASAPILVDRNGTIGLVAANCMAMLIRSAYSLNFAARTFRERQGSSESISTISMRLMAKMFPHPLILFCFVGSYFATSYSQQLLQKDDFYENYNLRSKEWLLLTFQHIGVGLSCVIGIGTIFYGLEREFRQNLVALVRPKQD